MATNRAVYHLVRHRWLLVIMALFLTALWIWFYMPDGVARLLRRDLTWQTIQNNGVWRVGMDPSFPPFEWLDEAGKPIGYDVALVHEIAAEWGVEVEIVAIGFDSLGDAVQTGRIDSVVSAFPYDERLTRDIAYSIPYFDAGIVLAVRSDSTLQQVDDLQGEQVAVEWGSMGDMVGRRLQREGLELELVQFDTPNETIAALLDERHVDAILIDHVTLRVAQVQGKPLVALEPLLESSPYVIAMPIRAYELQGAVTQALTTLQSDGTLATLEEAWFGRADR